MVSDEEIARGVFELLAVGLNPTVSSLNDVVHHLSANLGLDLSHKSAFIADQINLLRRHLSSPPQTPTSVFGNDRFALHNNNININHSQFLHQVYYQQQQRHVLPSPFTLHFGGYPHVTQQHPHVTHVHQQQHVAQPPVKNVGTTPKASKQSSQTGTKKRGGCGGLNKLCGVTPELQVIVGESTMSRTEIVRQLWAYIRKNNLQDPSNKRKIVCDEALRVVLETDCTDMFKMNKLLSKHILPLGPQKKPVSSKRQKLDVESGNLQADAVVAAETPKSTKTIKYTETPKSGETIKSDETPKSAESIKSAETSDGALLVISDALATFLGTPRRGMLASEAIQHVCEYVKVNGLEDPTSLIVICDEKLRELLGREKTSMLEINETLARHHLLQSS